ncbi:hypothetical protein E2C01_043308 [Portunus trituberculatus]|uniref:Uncharacterized protein n=1 Tax=Portunus trituberculatus TaxID=210409 RepID=A0A5B7FVZ1_PORTR|nr:hypothetical protein [Portunus trituberculatus]
MQETECDSGWWPEVEGKEVAIEEKEEEEEQGEENKPAHSSSSSSVEGARPAGLEGGVEEEVQCGLSSGPGRTCGACACLWRSSLHVEAFVRTLCGVGPPGPLAPVPRAARARLWHSLVARRHVVAVM